MVALFFGEKKKKHAKLQIQLLFGMIALFVRLQLLCSSVNRAKGAVVVKGSPIRYNITTPEK